MKIQPPSSEITWKDVVADALRKLGGEAHLKEIIALAEQHPKSATNSRVKEKVRQVVRAYSIFQSLEAGSGKYRLLADELELPFPGAPTTKEITDEIQGQLLYIGRANGFETYAPADDQTKRIFNGQPLRELVTLQSGFDELSRFKADETKIIRLIDVLWFREERGDLIPHCAFEVEHSTDVLTGLQRLNHLPLFFGTQLFIVGRDDAKKTRFDALLDSPTWNHNPARFKFRFFDEVNAVFQSAAGYQQARDGNQQAMQNFLN